MRHLKEYKLWEQSGELTPWQVDFLNNRIKGAWKLNSQGEVDVEGDFHYTMVSNPIRDLAGITFGTVSGNFIMKEVDYDSLRGFPHSVGKHFVCVQNRIKSLEGAPQNVGGHFYCNNNQLTSLEGAPEEVKGNFDCSHNKLTSLAGAPREVRENFDCSHNRLVNLLGGPSNVGWNFDCRYNHLNSFEGAPPEMGGNFMANMHNISQATWEMLKDVINGNPGMPYEAVLASLQNKIDSRDWDKLDKSSMERLTDKSRKGYKLLGGIGGI